MNSYEVNALPLPPLLIALLEHGRWQHPGDEALAALAPFLQEPVVFLPSVEEMRFDSSSLYTAEQHIPQLLHVARGSQRATPVELPWLDVELAFLIAVNRFPGHELGIALDYRTSAADPRVVASDWSDTSEGCLWREVAPSFSEFARLIGLN